MLFNIGLALLAIGLSAAFVALWPAGPIPVVLAQGTFIIGTLGAVLAITLNLMAAFLRGLGGEWPTERH